MKVDLNADLGEGFGPYRIGDDETLLEIVSSANIACGYHAGDPVIMDHTVRIANRLGVDTGAHPGLPDLMGFGRRTIKMDRAEVEKHVVYQIGALRGIAAAAGSKVSHVSYHGALGEMVNEDRDLAQTLALAISAVDRDLVVCSRPGTEIVKAARDAGLRTLSRFLADRAYAADGSLVSRKRGEAVIRSVEAVVKRVQEFLDDGTVATVDGSRIPIHAKSILVHSDTPGAPELARAVRLAVESGGGEIVRGALLAE